VIRILAIGITFFYPFIIYFGLAHVSPGILVGFLAAILLSRVLVGNLEPSWKLMALGCVVIGVVLHWWIHDETKSLKFYPVLLNTALMLAFGLSLMSKQPLIEMIARKRGMSVGAHNVRYLRVLTGVWTGFFTVGVVISTYTAVYGDMHIWLFYNGFVSYILMGLLVGGELIFRHFYRQRSNLTQ